MYMKSFVVFLAPTDQPLRSEYEEMGEITRLAMCAGQKSATGPFSIAGFGASRWRLSRAALPVEQESAAYEELKNGRAYTVLLSTQPALISMAGCVERCYRAAPLRELRVSCIGAGSFCARRSISGAAQDARCRFALGCDRLGRASESRRAAVCLCPSCATANCCRTRCECVFVLSRHDSHAPLVVAALGQSQPCCEKPWPSVANNSRKFACAYQAKREELAPFLMVGYNRRFAPFTEK